MLACYINQKLKNEIV